MPQLYAAEWDKSRGQWRDGSSSRVPTLWKAADYFRKQIRSVVENRKTGMVQVSVTWKDPALAARWANGLVELANRQLRERAIADADRHIAYLKSQLASESIVGVREATSSILATQLRVAMMARGSESYAFRVIDPAVPPERASSPSPALWIGTSFMLALALAVVALLVIGQLKDPVKR